MEHNEIRHKLSEYIDGSIPAEEKTTIEEHLKICASCGAALRELQKTIEHIKSLEEVESPAWMTQKIMAQVHAADAEQRSFLRKLFFPLSVKIPIQAVAVLFLVVGALYVYRSIQPSLRPAEAPVKEFEAKKEASPIPAESREKTAPEGASPSARRVPQTPEYKSLDMKQEYEKPAPPALMDKMTPAPLPAKPVEQPMVTKKEAQGHAAQASAPVIAENKTARAAGASGLAGKESSAASGMLTSKTADATKLDKVFLTLSVQHITDTAQKVEAILARMEGNVIKKEIKTDASVLTIKVNSAEIQKFADQLRELGTVKEKDLDATRLSGMVTIELVIVTPPQAH